MKKIVIAGGSGFLGQCLTTHFANNHDRVIILTRGVSRITPAIEYVHWDATTQGAWTTSLEDADVLINLTGKSVDCRYTEKNKQLIYSSRLDSTAALGQALQTCTLPPKLWINAASATIYRHSIDKEMDEYTGEIGSGFSVDVCQQWERTFNQFELKNTRKVLIRTGIVLGKNGGPFTPLKTLAKVGLGGKQGRGDQYFSWLHERDFIGIINFIIAHQKLEGVYNVTAPTPVPNRHIMKAMRNTLKIPVGLPLPIWVLEVGAVIINTETELILKSRRVVPKRLLDAGYQFEFETIEAAVEELL
jgi:uncharacterized protein